MGPLTQKYLTPFAPAVVFGRMLMGMGSPDNRRKADGSYQTRGVGRGICASSSARERANDGWAFCLSEDRDVLRGCAVGRRRGGLLLRLSRCTGRVHGASRLGRRVRGMASAQRYASQAESSG